MVVIFIQGLMTKTECLQQQQQQPLFTSHTYLYDSADPQSSPNTNRGGSGADKILIYIIYTEYMLEYIPN